MRLHCLINGAAVRLGLALLWVYRTCISPWTPRCCRFTPSCSEYARGALLRFGFRRGAWLTLRRLLRCHPFHRGCLYDPVPTPSPDRAGPGLRSTQPHGR